MNKFFIVLWHTFLSNVKSKSFIITTLVTALLVVVLFSLPSIISFFDKEEIKQIGVIDSSNAIYEPLRGVMLTNNSQGIELVPVSDDDRAKQEVEQGSLDGYIIVHSIDQGTISATYKAMKVNNSGLISQLEQALNQVQFRMKATNLGLSEQEANQLFQPMSLERIPLSETAKSEEEIIHSTVLVYILLFAIYFAIMMFGNMVAMEVIKEKSSRVMEILVSSVHPIAQMFGKILGIAMLGILQFSIYIAIGAIAMQFGDKAVSLGDMTIDFSTLPISTVVYAVVFFILAYLLYATIAAMLASLVSQVEDMQIITPLNIVIIAAFMIAMFGLSKPEAPFIIVTSFIPVFTPMIMFLRIGIADPALWEILLSIGLLIASIIAMAIFAAKVYRGGVLMYNNGASLKDLKKAISLHKKE
jgi:ABC-2 type transport system permease protein